MITVADSAKLRLQTFPMPDKSIGIRIGVRSSGCSGLAYVLEFCYNSIEEDIVILALHDMPSIFIDPKSMIHLTGTRLEYNKRGLNEGFEFVNPNVTSQCGCGESFYVE